MEPLVPFVLRGIHFPPNGNNLAQPGSPASKFHAFLYAHKMTLEQLSTFKKEVQDAENKYYQTRAEADGEALTVVFKRALDYREAVFEQFMADYQGLEFDANANGTMNDPARNLYTHAVCQVWLVIQNISKELLNRLNQPVYIHLLKKLEVSRLNQACVDFFRNNEENDVSLFFSGLYKGQPVFKAMIDSEARQHAVTEYQRGLMEGRQQGLIEGRRQGLIEGRQRSPDGQNQAGSRAVLALPAPDASTGASGASPNSAGVTVAFGVSPNSAGARARSRSRSVSRSRPRLA